MKKALHGQKEVFLVESHGNVRVWDFFAEEIVEAVNKDLEGDPAATPAERQFFRQLRAWINRYLKEGVPDDFLNDLNSALHEIRYSKYILPLDLMPSAIGYPQNGYVAKYNRIPSPKALAADDFSKLLTSGMLDRLKHCQSVE